MSDAEAALRHAKSCDVIHFGGFGLNLVQEN